MHIRGDKAINLKEVYEAREKGERREREKRGWKKGLWVDAEVQRITRYIFFFVENNIVEYLINRFEITRETLLEIKILLGVQIIKKKKNTQISIYIMFHAVRFFFFSFLSSPPFSLNFG